MNNESNREILEIRVEDIIPNRFQPRLTFDMEALNELANSIKEHGIIQPLVVRRLQDKYEIIAGERRYRASKIAGLETIPAIIRDFTDDEMMQISLLENLQRENLTAIEEAKAYKSIIEALGLTQDEFAKKIGKSRSYITNMLGLLKLPASVQDMVLYNKISMAHARVLSKLEDPKQIEALAEKVVSEGISVHSLEELTQGNEYKKSVKVVKNKTDNSEYKYIEKDLKEKLGTSVKINNNKLVIKFSNVQDLNRILEIMNISID